MAQMNLAGLPTISQEEYNKKSMEEWKESQKTDNAHLYRCKEFLEKLLKEKGEEALLWFETSAPYTNEVNVKLVKHKAWWSCVNFRYEKDGTLRAYDSNFGGGTSWVERDANEEESIMEIMSHVFANECCSTHWAAETQEEADIQTEKIRKAIKEDGWLDRDKAT